MLKRIVLSQQTFCEQVQRNNLAKNLVISGIPTGNLKYENVELCTTLQKVQAILSAIHAIHAPVDIENSSLYSFTTAQGKSTHTVKLTLDIESKKKVLNSAKSLNNLNSNTSL